MRPLHISKFENEIDSRILERGLEYYLDDRIQREDPMGDEYRFSVYGTDVYDVWLRIKGDEVVEYECDCPFDKGPVCKHVAACLYCLGKQSKMKKTKPVTNPYEKRLLKAIARSSYYGYIDWRNAGFLGDEADEMLEEAEYALQMGDYQKCFEIAIPVLVHMSEALSYSDDSNADIGDPVRGAFDLLMQVAIAEDLDEKDRRDLTDFCYSSFDAKTFDGWDWHLGMMELAGELARDRTEADRVIDTLKDAFPPINNQSWHYEYEREQSMRIVLSLIETYYPKEEADAFRNANLNIREFRDKAIMELLSVGELDEAKSLALDGIVLDSKDRPGIVSHWQNVLLRIAIRKNDRDDIIEYAEKLWLNGHFSNWIEEGDRDYDLYSLLKETVGEEDWPEYIERFAKVLLNHSGFHSISYPDLCVKEQWWGKLWDYVRESKSARTLKEYEKYLKKGFKEEIVEMYAGLVYSTLNRGVGRHIYQEACSYLRRMNKLGSRSKVDVIIADLRQKYPRRPALLDELDQV